MVNLPSLFLFIRCFFFFFWFVGQQSSGHQNLRGNIRKLHRQRMKMRSWTRKTKMSTERPCVEPVERTTHQTNFGFAVTSARSGSMASVWRLLLLGLSILSSTSAHHAATRELALDIAQGMRSLSLSTHLLVDSANCFVWSICLFV